jgi:hypothetical protein
MIPTRFLGILLAGALVAGCASLPTVERSRHPLATGTGSYLIKKAHHPGREGGRNVYFSRFYFGSNGFYQSQIFTIQKITSAGTAYYQLRVDMYGTDWANLHSIVVKADGSAFRLPQDTHPRQILLPVGTSRFQETYKFRLEPALVASLRTAGTIRIQDVAGPITLTPGQRSVLQSFLRDTAAMG